MESFYYLFQEYRPIPGHKDYFVSAIGFVLSKKRKLPIIMKQRQNKTGHFYILLKTNKKQQKRFVHRLVLLSWDKKPKKNEVCRHLDGNPSNNHIKNLKWGTIQDNADDRKRHGRVPCGERAATHKLKAKDVLMIRKLYNKFSLRYLAKKFNVSHTCIRRAALDITWSNLK